MVVQGRCVATQNSTAIWAKATACNDDRRFKVKCPPNLAGVDVPLTMMEEGRRIVSVRMESGEKTAVL
jgi:hypothetical protein